MSDEKCQYLGHGGFVDLLPCPFCGGIPCMVEDDLMWNIECTGCSALIHSYSDGRDAIEDWNRRAMSEDSHNSQGCRIQDQGNCLGLAPNSAAEPGYEYGQDVVKLLGLEKAHQLALEGAIIPQKSA